MYGTTLKGRITKCRLSLTKFIGEGTTLQSSQTFIEACVLWMKTLSTGTDVPESVLERCESFLKSRGDSLDEVDRKILELKSELLIN